ncbi:MAG: hypothetical protein K9I82_02160 [Chitinophagaceae bacterium]|nr:hypothetical protein [Chitinophagaceae bacterium]
MKTFKDLVFQPTYAPIKGVRATIDFKNGYGASVVRNSISYGAHAGLYELGVTKDDELHYDNPVANGDVIGWLSEEDVSELLIKIQNFS